MKILLALFILANGFANAQSVAKKNKIMADAEVSKTEFVKNYWQMEKLLEEAHGYVIFPNVGKGGLGVGGASGNGVAYENNQKIGMAKLSQLTIGFQAGGQAYQELVLFENEEAMNRFKSNSIEFSAQASAIVVTEGSSATAKYTDGVMIFTMQKGGLMYEASLGGQRLKFIKF